MHGVASSKADDETKELWYALLVSRRFERRVERQLSNKGYETFLPTYVSKRQCTDRLKLLSLPLFPTHVFCRFDLHHRLPILMTPGVNCILGVGRLAQAIDETEITAIQRLIESGLSLEPASYVPAGESVRVEEGPLKGVVGIISTVNGTSRLIVSVRLLMRSISVEIDSASVRPIQTYSKTLPNVHRIPEDKDRSLSYIPRHH